MGRISWFLCMHCDFYWKLVIWILICGNSENQIVPFPSDLLLFNFNCWSCSSLSSNFFFSIFFWVETIVCYVWSLKSLFLSLFLVHVLTEISLNPRSENNANKQTNLPFPVFEDCFCAWPFLQHSVKSVLSQRIRPIWKI